MHQKTYSTYVEVEVDLTSDEIRKAYKQVCNEHVLCDREIKQTLDDAAFKLRQQGHVALAWRLEEIKSEF